MILAGILIFVLFTGNNIGTVLSLFGLAVFYLFTDVPTAVIGNSIWSTLNNQAFAAIPLYFLLGEVISVTGIAQNIYASIAPLFSRLPGGLLQSNIGTCAFFSAISGSSTATTAAIGSIAYSELDERGYESTALLGSMGAGGTLGILIPPSTIMILYGAMEHVSIGKLFIAGLVPGVGLTLMYMLYIGVNAKLNPGIIPKEEKVSLFQAIKASLNAWPFFILMGTVLGTVFAGLATATEAASFGVMAGFVLAAFFGRFSLRVVWQSLMGTLSTFSAVASIFIGAVILGQAVSFAGLPDHLLELLQASGFSPYTVLFLTACLYVVLGCLFEPFSMVLITLPVVFPVITSLGFDPVWFGIFLVMLIELALLTPPVGMNLFILLAVSKGRHTLFEVGMACLPYIIIIMAALVLVTVFPQIVLWLPNLISL
jgi:tripartite ATP-independent transporter DctM subunit